MPENNDQIDENQDENVDVSEKTKAEEQIVQQLGSLVEHADGDKKLLAELLADPNVRAIIEAKSDGKKLKLVEETDKPQGSLSDLSGSGSLDDAEQSVDLDELSRNDFARVIMKKTIGLVSGVVSKELDGLGKDISAIKGYVKLQEDQRVDNEISATKKLHKDFGEYKDQMMDLSKRNPGLTIKQLYILAKSSSGDNVDVKVETERPETSSARMITRPKRNEPLGAGRPGMETLLDESLDKFDFSTLA